MSSLVIENKSIDTLTNQITYNRLLRGTSQILKRNIFEFNDEYTRNSIMSELKIFYNKAKMFAIEDYKITMVDYDESNPHYVEVHIIIQLKAMIHYVKLNISNYDEL